MTSRPLTSCSSFDSLEVNNKKDSLLYYQETGKHKVSSLEEKNVHYKALTLETENVIKKKKKDLLNNNSAAEFY